MWISHAAQCATLIDALQGTPYGLFFPVITAKRPKQETLKTLTHVSMILSICTLGSGNAIPKLVAVASEINPTKTQTSSNVFSFIFFAPFY